MMTVKVAGVQMSCTADKEANVEKAMQRIREATAKGAQIVCTQELFASLYFCDEENYDNFKLAELIPAETSETLSTLAAELNIVIVASLFEKRTKGIYHNTTVVIDADGTLLGKYRK
ncbi:MAG TPA: nitrilase-related carbon-nitrogen hydrolase, partial [Parafilimonas sp.]|nr:nitrilase-related carbon-nitrogen hydrolase [Parafilimonas sp.]